MPYFVFLQGCQWQAPNIPIPMEIITKIEISYQGELLQVDINLLQKFYLPTKYFELKKEKHLVKGLLFENRYLFVEFDYIPD